MQQRHSLTLQLQDWSNEEVNAILCKNNNIYVVGFSAGE